MCCGVCGAPGHHAGPHPLPTPRARTHSTQGDCLDGAVELILKLYSPDVKRHDIYFIESKKKEAYFGDEGEAGDED